MVYCIEALVFNSVCYSVARSDRSSDLEDEKNPKGSSNWGGKSN